MFFAFIGPSSLDAPSTTKHQRHNTDRLRHRRRSGLPVYSSTHQSKKKATCTYVAYMDPEQNALFRFGNVNDHSLPTLPPKHKTKCTHGSTQRGNNCTVSCIVPTCKYRGPWYVGCINKNEICGCHRYLFSPNPIIPSF